MGEDEVGYEPFPWVRNTKAGNSMLPKWAPLLCGNTRDEQYGLPIKFTLALTK